MILLDTNLLGRMTDSGDPQCAPARRAIHTLLAKRERLHAESVTDVKIAKVTLRVREGHTRTGIAASPG